MKRLLKSLNEYALFSINTCITDHIISQSKMHNQVIYAATPLICKIQTQIQLADEVDLQEFTQRLTKGIL